MTNAQLKRAIAAQREANMSAEELKEAFWKASGDAKSAFERGANPAIITQSYELRGVIAQQIVDTLSDSEIKELFTKYATFVRNCAY